MISVVKPIMAKDEVQLYGYVEKVTLVEKQLPLSAKLDTGAKSASLNASQITEFQKDGKPYLRFIVSTKDNKEYLFEAPYVGKVKIKVRAQEGGSCSQTAPIKRPVVLMSVQLGQQVKSIKVNLTNRKRFNYPFLLGRDAIIAFNGAVNPALKFTMSKSSTNHEK